MNMVAVFGARVRSFVKVREQKAVSTWEEKKEDVIVGVKRGVILVLILWCLKQVSAGMHIPEYLILGAVSFLFVVAAESRGYFFPAGMSIGAFVTVVVVVPLIVLVEKFWVWLGKWMSWHSADGPVFYDWNQVGVIMLVFSGSVFLPYLVGNTRRTVKTVWRTLRTKDQERWARKKILKGYREGQMLCRDSPEMDKFTRDIVSEEWSRFTPQGLEETAVLVATIHDLSVAETIQEFRQIHRRAKQRIESRRYKERHPNK